MFTVIIKDTYDGADGLVYLNGELVMRCTWLGESNEALIEMAKNHITTKVIINE